MWLCEVRLPPERSKAVPFVAQKDAAPRFGCFAVQRHYGDTTLVRLKAVNPLPYDWCPTVSLPCENPPSACSEPDTCIGNCHRVTHPRASSSHR
jgi:hypothetical protein